MDTVPEEVTKIRYRVPAALYRYSPVESDDVNRAVVIDVTFAVARVAVVNDAVDAENVVTVAVVAVKLVTAADVNADVVEITRVAETVPLTLNQFGLPTIRADVVSRVDPMVHHEGLAKSFQTATSFDE